MMTGVEKLSVHGIVDLKFPCEYSEHLLGNLAGNGYNIHVVWVIIMAVLAHVPFFYDATVPVPDISDSDLEFETGTCDDSQVQ